MQTQAKQLFRTFLMAVVFSGCFAACSETAISLPKGRCDSNADCNDGEECVKTYCQDIYHPRSQIKPY